MNMKQQINLGALGKPFRGLEKLHLERINPMLLIGVGAALLALLASLFLLGGGSQKNNEDRLEQARQTISQVSGSIKSYRRVLVDQQVQELAVIAASDRDKLLNLQQYMQGRIPELIEMTLFEPDINHLRGRDMGPFGYAVLDMLMNARESGLAPVQVHGQGAEAYLALATRVGDAELPAGYLLVKVELSGITTIFKASIPEPGMFSLDQFNGRFAPTKIANLKEPPSARQGVDYMRVPGALLRIGVVRDTRISNGGGVGRFLLLVFGLLLLALGLLLKFRPYEVATGLEEDPAQIEQQHEGAAKAVSATVPRMDKSLQEQTGNDPDDGLGAISLPDLGFNLEHPSMPPQKALPPVELVESIFRAYDIRGIVGETLDAEVARQVGQVVGSLTLEADAGPVIVARDGRHSGPALVAGMIEGISSTGCDVVDIGAVPTGVLYFAAYELGTGTGVMITGSHNPSNYNGFKILIGGITWAGEKIAAIYERIHSGNLRVGKGEVSTQDVLKQYREKISGDIQLQRPLKVVADCGNGIGGVCAIDVLRDIGAEVIPLFDEVDGSFPNHHPDPSEPENLKDLIESVRLMEADIGVAFDGDADRLGVVTKDGEIIYSDRLMMLFARDVLSRVPGATIIYDVKCTGQLHAVIEAAGGNPMMYKTGHSLIKNKMKEVGAPFAGEMSGHFFFEERWYGFDCGIYAAARLLEILAADERDPQEVLNSLPNSFSTPELKVHLEEGENHAFVQELQEKARFADARINTIDGLRADFADGWGLVRASNTTPILVLRFEADTEEGLERIKGVFKQQMLAIKSDLQLPI